MRKLVACTKCSEKFVPPPEPPFFPCPNCREEELTARFADSLAGREHTGDPVDLANPQDNTWKVVAAYSLLRHTIFEGTFSECREFMTSSGESLITDGYHDWELVSPKGNDPHHKVDDLHPKRRCRPPKQAVRFKYSPHYPRARPTTESGVAEYQPYEMGMARRWVYMWEVGKWNFR
jgi:hypothetical protein